MPNGIYRSCALARSWTRLALDSRQLSFLGLVTIVASNFAAFNGFTAPPHHLFYHSLSSTAVSGLVLSTQSGNSRSSVDRTGDVVTKDTAVGRPPSASAEGAVDDYTLVLVTASFHGVFACPSNPVLSSTQPWIPTAKTRENRPGSLGNASARAAFASVTEPSTRSL